MTNALALANSENSLFWANLISQVAIGWGLTMIFNTAIINGDTEKYASYLQKLHLMKPKLIDPIVIN